MQHSAKSQTIVIDDKVTIDEAFLLHLRNTSIETVELAMQIMPVAMVRKILAEIKNNPKITHLILRDQKIDNLTELIKMIESNNAVQSLNFTETTLDAWRLKSLLRIENHSSLREIKFKDLDSNYSGYGDAEQIKLITKLIGQNKKINSLTLTDSYLYPETVAFIAQLIQNGHIQDLVLNRVKIAAFEEQTNSQYEKLNNIVRILGKAFQSKFLKSLVVDNLEFLDKGNEEDETLDSLDKIKLLHIILDGISQNTSLKLFEFIQDEDTLKLKIDAIKKAIPIRLKQELNEQKKAFLMGSHSRAGTESSVRKALVSSSMYDKKNILRSIFDMMDESGYENENSAIVSDKKMQNLKLTKDKIIESRKKINLQGSYESLLKNITDWVNLAINFQKQLLPYQPPATGLFSILNWSRSYDDNLLPNEREIIQKYLIELEIELSTAIHMFEEKKELEKHRDAVIKIIAKLESAPLKNGTVMSELNQLTDNLRKQYPKSDPPTQVATQKIKGLDG